MTEERKVDCPACGSIVDEETATWVRKLKTATKEGHDRMVQELLQEAREHVRS